MKGCSAFPKSLSITGTSSLDYLVSCQDTCWGRPTFLQRSSRCILLHPPAYWNDTMGCIDFYGVWASVWDSFVCFGTKPTQGACAWDFPRDRTRAREGRSQSTEVDRIDQDREQGSRQKRAGAKTCGLRTGLANVRGWVSVPCGFVGILLEYTLALAHRCTEIYAKVSQTSPFLRLELT